uniref:Uncharacterized protein n=1 Tax=Anguilla anguilla TaxID=7936 RepID=A0A0E9TFN6_ANGAN
MSPSNTEMSKKGMALLTFLPAFREF